MSRLDAARERFALYRGLLFGSFLTAWATFTLFFVMGVAKTPWDYVVATSLLGGGIIGTIWCFMKIRQVLHEIERL